MSMLADDSLVMRKAKELCAVIVEHPDFSVMQERVEAFLDDDSARLQYQSVQERGEELHHKQHSGVELSRSEIQDWESARDSLLENEVARSFIEAKRQLELLQQTIGKYVGLTLELGRVPEPEDFADASGGGCCGGHGGCGCSH
jgi:cell fate (sporulation/competence/biofilm development) regulator YlbF (YheA/YmcA/DUF963 family)